MLEEEKKLAEENALKQAEKPAEKVIFQTPVYNWIIIGILSLFLIGTGIYAGIMYSKWHKLTHQAQVYIYNPTENDIHFKLNHMDFYPNREFEVVTLPFGKYEFSMGGKTIETFTIDETSRHAIINPTLTSLVKYNNIYMKDLENLSEEEQEKIEEKAFDGKTTVIDGQTYRNAPELIEKKYFIKKDWDYHPWELSSHTYFHLDKEYEVLTELYTLKDFKERKYSIEELEEIAKEEAAEDAENIIEE